MTRAPLAEPAGGPTGSPYRAPPLECDIVMKGGITSGVVYPGAVISLAPRYRFRSIGGTSAGAIAAAIVAAAEHARRNGDVSGFVEIEKLPDTLGAGGDDPFMLQLFQPDKETRQLFSAAIGFKKYGKVRALWGVVFAFWRSSLLAVVVALAAVLLCTLADADWAFGVAGIAASIAILAIGVTAETLRAVRRIEANDFGFCRLGPGVGTDEKPALTAWLHDRIQSAAGRVGDRRPLTFADLWGAPRASGPAVQDKARLEFLRAASVDPDRRRIDLQMMTTDLTQGRPLRLPVLYNRHEATLEDFAGLLLFDRVELARFFPKPVVEHLKLCAEPFSSDTLEKVRSFEAELPAPGDGAAEPRLFRLPIGPDLPVIVATRMSLSFPLLISVIPLWRLTFAEGQPKQIVRVVFSDGGITSNFPIHLFDAPLPRRPTFGLHLTNFAPGEIIDRDNARACVDPPPGASENRPEATREVADLKGFAVALKDAAQNWRDNAQARLPGFRDRIAHIKLDDGEGGLNLDMQQEDITRLNNRGTVAGNDLRELFSGTDEAPAPTRYWSDHRFTRYRETMAVLERVLRSYRDGYATAPADGISTTYAARIVEGEVDGVYPFGSPRRRKAAETTSAAYVDLVDGWGEDWLDDANVPRPPAVMRTIPPG